MIDTAPILAITDSAIIGKYVGTSLLIAYYGVNTVKDIELSLKRFKQNDIEITGVILRTYPKRNCQIIHNDNL